MFYGIRKSRPLLLAAMLCACAMPFFSDGTRGIADPGTARVQYGQTAQYPAPDDIGDMQAASRTSTVTEYSAPYAPRWEPLEDSGRLKINLTVTIAVLALMLALLCVLVLVRGTGIATHEDLALSAEMNALVKGDVMPQQHKIQRQIGKRNIMPIRLKLVLLSVPPIMLVNILIVFIFGTIMVQRESRTLSEGLASRANVILDSITRSAQTYMPAEDIVSLNDALRQVNVLPEANFVTICGANLDAPENAISYVWATTDSNILNIIDTDGFLPGHSRILSERFTPIFNSFSALRIEASSQMAALSSTMSDLTQEYHSLLGREDTVSYLRRQEIQEVHSQLMTRADIILTDLSMKYAGSLPRYDKTKMNLTAEEYLLYRPILFYEADAASYVKGVVLLLINTQALRKSVQNINQTVILLSSIIIMMSFFLCIMIAFVIAARITRPINNLVQHVAFIRDTEDKEKLLGKDIKIKSHDELGVLGDTVNEMAHALADASKISKTLVVGKEVQTKFIPLNSDEKGNLLSHGSFKMPGADFFAYYAGTDELSGDYIDYKQIGEHHFAIIKCDISGHGAPAALIMVEVATLFLDHFSNWDMNSAQQGTNLIPVVSQINDLLESRGFKGRFAAFTLCIFDSLSGDCYFCNAGDNLIQVYDSFTGKKQSIALQETPAAGMFDTQSINLKGGYRMSKITLKKNDILFLYTDGIEESKRVFRDAMSNVMTCKEAGLSEGETHGNHTVGDTGEPFSPQRVTDVIEAVISRTGYTLSRYHDTLAHSFTFDFSECTGSAEETILALVSVEKVFRFYRSEAPKNTDRVRVDRKIDEFLRAHFNQYSLWCSNHQEIKEDPTHIYYRGILEDRQFDDITLAAIKKLN